MSYAIYKTEAFIIRITPNGEASQDVTFMTRDLGKITARAQSARKGESKMRMHITKYNHVVIDAVRGKNIWRLTGITTVEQNTVFKNNDFLQAWYRITSLAEHLIRGEEPHPELFDFFKLLSHSQSLVTAPLGKRSNSHQQALENSSSSCQEEVAEGRRSLGGGVELFGVIHVLDMLGYWHGEKLSETPTEEVLKTCLENKKELIKMINESIEATQIVV